MSAPYRFGVIGRQIDYSLSPIIFQAIFASSHVDGTFELFSLGDEPLAEALKRLRSAGITGLSATIPYKRGLLELLDEVDPIAAEIGAVNCLTLGSAKTAGYNTDWSGFLAGLPLEFQAPSDASVLLIGNGGAADSVVYALHRLGLQGTLEVLGREAQRASRFCNRWQERVGPRLVVRPMTSTSGKKFDLIANCSPLGGPADPDKSPLPSGVAVSSSGLYYDLNYNADNRVVASARSGGNQVVDGSVMLVAQAVESFRIWTGLTVPVPEIYRTVFGNRT